MRALNVGSIAGRNAIWNLLRYLVNFLVVFILIPVIIKAVGEARYGLWALVFSIVGYAGLLDLGVQQATVKLVSQYRGKRDVEGINGVASAALAFFFTLSLVAAAACWFVLPGLMHHFVDDPAEVAAAIELLRVIGAGVFFLFVGNVFTGIALGLHQYHYKGIVDSVLGVARLGLSMAVLHQGWGLVGLAWVKLGLDACSMGFMWWACRRGLPGLRLGPSQVSTKLLGELFTFGRKVFTASSVIRLSRASNPVIVAYFLGTTFAGYFAVATRLTSYASEILMSLSAGFMPIFSELGTSRGASEVRRVYLRYSRLFVALTAPAYVGLLICGPRFVALWIDPGFARETALALQLMAGAALVRGLQPLHARVLVGWGEVGFYTRLVSACMLVSVAGGAALVPVVGIAGPPLAGLAMSLVQQSVILVHLSRRLQFSRIGFALSCHGRLLPALAAYAGVLVVLTRNPLLPGWAGLALSVASGVCVYGALAWLLVLGQAERSLVRSWLSRLRAGRRRAEAPSPINHKASP